MRIIRYISPSPDLDAVLDLFPKIVEYCGRNDGLSNYCGEFAGNIRYGVGLACWESGREYAGEWVRDVPEGYGYEMLDDGSSYIGMFQDGKRHGVGQFIIPSNYCYCGEWKFGCRNGIGKEFEQDCLELSGSAENNDWIPLNEDRALIFER